MIITPQDIINHFGLSCPESLQMFVRWIDFSPSQQNPKKSEPVCVPNGIQLGAGQFAYVTLKTQTGKYVFKSFIFANTETSFIKTSNQRVSRTYYNMYGARQKNKIANIFEAYRNADEVVSAEEAMPLQQRLDMLAKRSNGSYDKFLGIVKAHEVINGFDSNQVAEIKRFWDDWSGKQQTPQQAPQAAPLAQSPFATQQQPAPIASGPLQSPFVAQQPIQQAPITPPMAPQIQTILAALQSICNQLQQLLMPNTAQSITPRVQ